MYRYSPTVRRGWRIIHRGLYSRLTDSAYTVMRMQRSLCAYGFPVGRVDGKVGPATRSAVKHFQEAFNGGKDDIPLLRVDGVLGPLTRTALRQLPYLSPHFTAAECWSKGNGDCYVKRELLTALELERTELGRPLSLISCYRDPAYNATVGGAKYSRHLFGEAADISRRYYLYRDPVKAKERYGGIGCVSRRDTRCVHLDVRHTSGAGSSTSPNIWYYN